MPKTYADTGMMTERHILEEIQAIADLSPDEMTLTEANRVHDLKQLLGAFERAHEPARITIPLMTEVRALRAMRRALVELRDRIDAAHLDEGWSYVERINAVLALASE